LIIKKVVSGSNLNTIYNITCISIHYIT
jgi:hypothetical protein